MDAIEQLAASGALLTSTGWETPEEVKPLEWDDFIKDMDPAQKKDFAELSRTAQLKAFNHWMKTEGLHIDYTFKN